MKHIFLFLTFIASAAHAQSSIPWKEAADAMLKTHPETLGAMREQERRHAAWRADGAIYVPRVQLDANINSGQMPTLSGMDVVPMYSETVTLGAQLSWQSPVGTRVSLRAEGGRSFRRVTIIPTMAITTDLGPGYSFGFDLTLTQPLMRGFGDEVGYAQRNLSQLDADSGKAEATQTANDLLVRFVRVLTEAHFLTQERDAQNQTLTIVQRQYDEAKVRMELGQSSQADLYSFESNLFGQQEALLNLETELERKNRELQSFLSHELASKTVSIDGLVECIDALPFLDEKTVTILLPHTLAMQVLQLQLERAKTSSRIAGDPHRPRLDAQATFGMDGLGRDEVPRAFEQVGRADNVTAGVSLVFEASLDGTRENQENIEAALLVARAEENLESRALQLQVSFKQLQESHSRIETRRRMIESMLLVAQKLREAEEERFKRGAQSSIMVLEADKQVLNAQLRLLRIQRESLLLKLEQIRLSDRAMLLMQ